MPNAQSEVSALLLSRGWRDGTGGIELTLWGASQVEGPVKAVLHGQEALFFVPRNTATSAGRREPRALRSLRGEDMDALYFRAQRELNDERNRLHARGLACFESDLKPADRFLMERFVTGGFVVRGAARRERGVLRFDDPQVRAAEVRPDLRLLALDIETDGFGGPILSIALAAAGFEHVFIKREGADLDGISFHPDERAVLEVAFAALRNFDPDLIVGWNVIEFDLRVLEARARLHGLPFAVGRGGELGRILQGARENQPSLARIPGRVVLDGIATLKNATFSFERYTLQDVALQLLGRGKAIKHTADPVAEIRRMHAEEPLALAAYNLEDCRLVLDIFTAAKLLDFAVERAYLSGLPLDRQGGSVAAFDHQYLPRLHRRGFVAPDVRSHFSSSSPGGHVLDSVPGLYRNVLAFDFRSLYPSIICTFAIDPLGLWQPGADRIEGFDGASFARHQAILPEIVAHLSEARARAQTAKNDALQRAIKILMNSFYGVLGAPGCRFFDARLASSITRRGHEIIERSRRFFEERGVPIIYGDTDSLFGRLPEDLDELSCRAEGAKLATQINAFWQETLRKEFDVESTLQMRFESHYLRFLMPTMRGSELGSKKRYAGLIHTEAGKPELVIRGLEAIRRDWTPLARTMQRELLRRVFEDEPFQDWLRSLRADVAQGKLDTQLAYRRRLRRQVSDYEGSPPHVRAARMLAEDFEGREVEYVVTTRGPEPLSRRSAPIDYAHYIDKQLAPAADVVLPLLGTSFEQVTGAQLRLF